MGMGWDQFNLCIRDSLIYVFAIARLIHLQFDRGMLR
jgi:hypothetical protein